MKRVRSTLIISCFFLYVLISNFSFSFYLDEKTNLESFNYIKNNFLKIGQYNAWENNGTIICDEIGRQSEAQICSDGEGGTIITWTDSRELGEDDIYAQRINSNGETMWNSNGIVICNKMYDQFKPKICSDGEGGAIIAWLNFSNGEFDIYAQKINSNGEILWKPNGTLICNAFERQEKVQICFDGEGGALITWEDNRNVLSLMTSLDIYAQRINSNGEVLWEPNGTPICTEYDGQIHPQICSDGEGGAIIIWEDDRWLDFPTLSGQGIYGQRISSEGTPLWEANGTAICIIEKDQINPRICSDGEGGVIVTWSDSRISYEYYNIYAQRIDPLGNGLWEANGIAICKQGKSQREPEIIFDGAAGAIIAWTDYRFYSETYDYAISIYAQKVNSDGDIIWKENGEMMYNQSEIFPLFKRISCDGEGGAILSWYDERVSFEDYNIYAQWINATGDILWNENGIIICNEINNQLNQDMCSDGNGGVIISWADYRDSLYEDDIYAQKIVTEYEINNPPELIQASVNPKIGDKDTLFTFEITYFDSNNNEPQHVNVIINDSSRIMQKVDSTDTNYIDGCLYQYQTFLYMSPYNYTYQFECSDGYSIISTERFTDLQVDHIPGINNGDFNVPVIVLLIVGAIAVSFLILGIIKGKNRK
ncbi:MAG: hypothetical protein JW891_03915 [Candidatus Lokiarchaeota archaeon]|nr:hypothetical protein [Candidatus Lokiarchaeota archaeon]